MQPLTQYLDKDGSQVERPVKGGKIITLNSEGKPAGERDVRHLDIAEFYRTRGQADMPDAPQGREMRFRDPQDQNRADAYYRREQRKTDRAAETAAYQKEVDTLAKTAAEHGVRLDEKQILDGMRQTTPEQRQRVLADLKRSVEAGANKAPEAPKTDGMSEEKKAEAEKTYQAAQDAYLRGNTLNERGQVVSVQSIENEKKRKEKEAETIKKLGEQRDNRQKVDAENAAAAKERANATADAPNVIRDKNGNVVGYSYRTKAADKDGNVTDPELAKKESQTAANAKVDGVSATDAVRIGAANRFTEQTGVKQPGSGDYKARVAEQAAHNNVIRPIVADLATAKVKNATKEAAATTDKNQDAFSRPTTAASPPPTIASTSTRQIHSRVNPNATGSGVDFSSIDGREQTSASPSVAGASFASVDGYARPEIPKSVAQPASPAPAPVKPATPKVAPPTPPPQPKSRSTSGNYHVNTQQQQGLPSLGADPNVHPEMPTEIQSAPLGAWARGFVNDLKKPKWK